MGQKIRYDKPMLIEIMGIQSAAAACSAGSCEAGVSCSSGSKPGHCNTGNSVQGNCGYCGGGASVQTNYKWGSMGCGGGGTASTDCKTGYTAGSVCSTGQTIIVCHC